MGTLDRFMNRYQRRARWYAVKLGKCCARDRTELFTMHVDRMTVPVDHVSDAVQRVGRLRRRIRRQRHAEQLSTYDFLDGQQWQKGCQPRRANMRNVHFFLTDFQLRRRTPARRPGPQVVNALVDCAENIGRLHVLRRVGPQCVIVVNDPVIATLFRQMT